MAKARPGPVAVSLLGDAQTTLGKNAAGQPVDETTLFSPRHDLLSIGTQHFCDRLIDVDVLLRLPGRETS